MAFATVWRGRSDVMCLRYEAFAEQLQRGVLVTRDRSDDVVDADVVQPPQFREQGLDVLTSCAGIRGSRPSFSISA